MSKSTCLTKVLLTGFIAVLISAAPLKADDMENPLYMPEKGTGFFKASAGIMYKEANDNLAMQAKNHVGATEFPVGRFSLDSGYGLTDRMALRFILGWTQNNEIDRSGMHNGRLGLNYRVYDGAGSNGWVWDAYADANLAGAIKMGAKLVQSPNTAMVLDGTYPLSFNYDGYSHGRWGVWAGTRAGKTWNKFTGAAFAEIERTFGNNNSDVKISDSAKNVIAGLVNSTSPGAGAYYIQGLPESFSIDTKSTWEYNFGFNGLYEIDDNWSFGGGFSFKHRAANSIEAVILTAVTTAPLTDAQVAAITNAVAGEFLGSLDDGWDEYVLSTAISRKLTDSIQFSVYGEYTFDSSQEKSQSGTRVKGEAGVRLNFSF